MKLSEVASVSGKGGLFKVIAPTKSAIILESLDENKTKMIATTHHRVSLLHEISIYTHTEEGTVPLKEVLRKIHKDYGNDLGLDHNADPAELKSFLKDVLPEYDEDRVYVSDIKKLVRWYAILLKYAPDVITAEDDEKEEGKKEDTTEKEPAESTTKESAKSEKPKAKKAPSAKKESGKTSSTKKAGAAEKKKGGAKISQSKKSG